MSDLTGLGQLGGASLGIMGEAAGSAMQHQWAQQSAHSARQFAERMRSTQYQTAVADMKAAGLNPMLAYTQGGAGTPNVQGPMVPDVDLASGAARGAAVAKQIQTASADLGLARATKDKVEQDADSAQSLAIANRFEPYLRSQQQEISNWNIANLKASVNERLANVGLTNAQQKRSEADASYLEAQRKVVELGGPSWDRAITRRLLDASKSSALSNAWHWLNKRPAGVPADVQQ